jgi:hypothetical protein
LPDISCSKQLAEYDIPHAPAAAPATLHLCVLSLAAMKCLAQATATPILNTLCPHPVMIAQLDESGALLREATRRYGDEVVAHGADISRLNEAEGRAAAVAAELRAAQVGPTCGPGGFGGEGMDVVVGLPG